MSDRAMQADIGDATLDSDVARWSTDPGLAPVFTTRDGVMLVIDATAERVLHASADGVRLRDAITDEDGRVRAGLRLGQHAPTTGKARLVRIRFDTRGIARPTACVIARATRGTGEAVLLLSPTEPLPALRSVIRPNASTLAEAVSKLDPATPTIIEPAPASRIVWRSDAEGVLRHVSGGVPEIAADLVGRSWQALGESGAVNGPTLLAALDARQTFRGLPLILRLPEATDEIEIELSGAPSARPAYPFTGFSGFGVVRETRSRSDHLARASSEELPKADPAPSAETTGADASTSDGAGDPHDTQASLAAVVEAEVAPAGPAIALFVSAPEDADADALAAPSVEIEPRGPLREPMVSDETAEPSGDGEAAHAVAPGSAPTTNLSTHEHDAFREIARALGARFAGDDESAVREPLPDGERRGAVMAFPISAAPSANAAIDAAIVSALDRLPAGVLVHREAAILYVNRRFHELTGYPDRSGLEAAGILPHLLGRLPPHEDGFSPDTPVSITTGGGAMLALLVERSRVDWDGGPAELIMVRAAAQADRTREEIARGLFQARETTRERDAQDLLDHIEEGVATLDETGRVLTLNGSAKAILASQAREIVGGSLADLFSADSEPAVAASLSEAQERGASEPRTTTPRTGQGSTPLRLRITRLSEANTARFCVTLRQAETRISAEPRQIHPDALRRTDFLTRVSEEIRTPLNGILSHAEEMLAERAGPLGSERYREALREIQLSGTHVIGVVDDLVDLARIEAGRGDLTFTDIALNDVVSGCIAEIQPQAARDRIVVRTSLSPDLRPLVADERSMRQATLNVIANAMRLTEAGGQVIVSTTTAERGEIAFRVRDTGLGMTQDEIERALMPFGHSGVIPGRTGPGLGLTLTKALVEANRGRLLITSRKNEGTLVEMLFPPPQALSA